ncbi:hypothetical protein [Candidatus Neptunochlamydia vexilliferae]|uniref:Uncharacterized protein n=1 Tax=Candidatus Neptunichlamydia vexilliferae TaxID=1651774 RepID=A0ABS0B0J3_9BACT|nr:hypothetical protein [Candidatus Neptunochlamydia vexilliferae]MBF5059226.1 hypothetical protein [Candidatus Neptunochlamydia vexilliferae]
MKEVQLTSEQYTKGSNTINYVVYRRSDGRGRDEVLQHKIGGTSETAHVTLHPDGTVNFRIIRFKKYLEEAIKNNLQGYTPKLSYDLRKFIMRVSEKL